MGLYPAPPDHRMAYDRDGSSVLIIDPSTMTVETELTTAQVDNLNDQDSDAALNVINTKWLTIVFPEARDLSAYVLWATPLTDVRVSADTTNGIDGTWTSLGIATGVASSVTDLRTKIQAISESAMTGIAFVINASPTFGTDLLACHLYGVPSAGQNPDRLDVWDPALDQRADPAVFDFGDAARGSTEDKTFRIKNVSSTKTASGITVSMESLTDGTPSFVGQHTLSNGGAFAASVSIADLAPGAISPVLTLRQVLADDANLSLWWLRVVAAASSWA